MRPLPISFAALLLFASAAMASKPQEWTAASQKDFAAGSFHQTVVDSAGQLTLGRALDPVNLNQITELVPAFAQTRNGDLYVAANPDGKIFRITGDTAKLVYNAPTGFGDITAMATDHDGNLLVAFTGKSARLVELSFQNNKPTATTRFENENVDTIWAIATAPDGQLYLGTGPHGKVYRVAPNADAGEVVLEAPAKNVLALAFDHAANLIAGTDEKGLVIRLDPQTKKSFILLDAGKVDINAIVADKQGNLYAAAAHVSQQEQPPEPLPDTDGKPAASAPSSPDTRESGIRNQGSGSRDQESGINDARRLGRRGPIDSPSPLHAAKNFDQALTETPIQNILADTPPEVPPALRKLLANVAEKNHESPATRKKTPLGNPDRSDSRNRDNGPSESDDNQANPNAVYRITPDGSVTTVLQQPDLNYSLLLDGSDLLIGTGNDGKLFRYRTTDESVTLLARLKNEHITALFTAKDGEVLVGCANPGQVYRLGATLADTGTYTSEVFDAGHVANWGSAILETLPGLPPGTTATIATRTGNTRTLSEGNEKFWSDWSPEISAAAPPPAKITSPAARRLQYRITLTANEKTQAAPIVSRVHIGYQTKNLAPQFKSLYVHFEKDSSDDDETPARPSDDAPTPSKIAKVYWKATDPNHDTLVFRIYYRSATFVNGKPDTWTPLAKDLKSSSWEWDTRSLADGKYQVKVVASDKPDNTAADAREAAWVSTWLPVDHTPPVMSEPKASAVGDKAAVTGDAADETSTVTDIRYQVDSQGDWQPAAASAKIFDSAHETFKILTGPLAAGAHRITVRAIDSQGNAAYKTATVDIHQ